MSTAGSILFTCTRCAARTPILTAGLCPTCFQREYSGAIDASRLIVAALADVVTMTRDHYDALQRTVGRLESQVERLEAARDANREALLEANRMVCAHSMPYGWTAFQARNLLPSAEDLRSVPDQGEDLRHD